MKVISVKLPLSIYTEMCERGHLNPDYVRNFIQSYYENGTTRVWQNLKKHEIKEPTTHYYFRIHEGLLSDIQSLSSGIKLPTNELLGRLFDKFYYHHYYKVY